MVRFERRGGKTERRTVEDGFIVGFKVEREICETVIYIKTIDISLDSVQYDAVRRIIKVWFLLGARKSCFILMLRYKKDGEFSLAVYISFFLLFTYNFEI